MHDYYNTHRESIDQPGKVANPARGQLNRENEYFPVPVRVPGTDCIAPRTWFACVSYY